MNKVVHFELPAQDTQRMKKFYSDNFGWSTTDFPEQNYVVVRTGPTDEKGMILDKGFINGGFYHTDQKPLPAPNIVIAVDDLDEALAKVEPSGGKIVAGKVEIPQTGWYAKIADTEGNLIALLQPTNM